MFVKNLLKKCKPLVKLVYYVHYCKAHNMAKKNGFVCSFDNLKSLFYLPYLKTDEIQRNIYFGKNYYERDYLDYISSQWNDGIINKVVKTESMLDIGANIGNHTLFFLNECDAKFVYSFEPASDTFQILKKNIEINHLEGKSKLFNVGVGSHNGNANIASSKEKNTAYTQISLASEGNIKVVSIDELDIQEKIGFVKVDVEGFEYEVIKGMQNTLKKNKPYIMIEMWKKNLDNICSILEPIGYHVKRIQGNDYLGDYLCYVD